MTDESNDPLRALGRDVKPPDSLKPQVISTLHGRGLLHTTRARPLRYFVPLAAALFVFIVGRESGKASITDAPRDGRRSYMLLLYEDSTFDRSIPEQTYIAEYTAWADTLRRRDAMVNGMPLEPTSVVLTGGSQTDRDVASEAGTMSGFFIIRATNQEEAVAIAKTCPHLRHGGRVAVRPVVQT